jgi:hypothetical protein
MALREIKKARKEARDRDLFLLAILQYQSNDTGHSLVATLCNTSGQGLRGITADKFFLRAGGKPVQDFLLQEYVCETPVHAAIVLCLADNLDQAISADLDAAMKRCSRTRRPADILTVSKLSHEVQVNSRAGAAESVDGPESAAARLRTALPDIDFSLPNLHLVVIGASPATAVIEPLLELASTTGASIHVLGWAAEWQAPELKRRIENTNGFFRIVDKQNDLAQACFESYLVLQQHYRLTWQTGAGDLELELRAEAGGGFATYRQLVA